VGRRGILSGLQGAREGRKRDLKVDDVAGSRLDSVCLKNGVLRGALGYRRESEA
jgi:hypothetical protein